MENSRFNLAQFSERLDAITKATDEERNDMLREIYQRQVDSYNSKPGNLNVDHVNGDDHTITGDGYNCPLCMNRGDSLALREEHGSIFTYAIPCKCMKIRQSIWRMRQSGLERVIRDCTFDKFIVKADWQRTMYDKAKNYVAEGEPNGKWFFIGGQSGAGKSHICTAIVRELLYKKPVVYMPWEPDSKKLKAIVNDAEEYGKEIGRLNRAEVLYIDDLFKPVPDDFGGRKKPSGPDVKLAFEILNYRNINHLPTIISSEWPMDALIDIDEATASRINENCDYGRYLLGIGKDRKKNYRLSNMITL